jgi:uncharacterized protein (DUF2147 family)
MSGSLGFVIALTARSLGAQASPVGFWNTISDTDGKPTAIVEIRESAGELTGIVRGLLVPADAKDSVCEKCSGSRHGERIVGMEIIRHMRRNGDVWSGGEILDPESGKVYRATMRLAEGGRRLIVRGYIGFSIFGRSQTWRRREEHSEPNGYGLGMSPSSRSHASVGSIVSRAPRKSTPSSPTAFELSANQ